MNSMLQSERKNWELSKRLIAANSEGILTEWNMLPTQERCDDFVQLVFIIALARVGEFTKASDLGGLLLKQWSPRFKTWFHLLTNRALLFCRHRNLEKVGKVIARCYLLLAGTGARFSCFGHMYLAMWTNHEQALPYTTNLYAQDILAPEDGGVRYKYFHSFILALNGIIDPALDLCDASVQDLQKTHQQEPFFQYWLHEGLSLLATISFYAGRVETALRIHRDVQKIFPTPAFFSFNEVFNSSMALRAALAARNYEVFSTHMFLLKRIMGKKYDLRFALRTHSFEAILALLRGDQKDAYKSISKADSFAEKSPSKIELFYHYTQKSRIFLVDGMVNEAINLARESAAGIMSTSSSGFHIAEALFQHLKCLIVAHATLAMTKEHVEAMEREERSVLKSLSAIGKHSAFMKDKITLYKRLLKLARTKTQGELTAFIKGTNQIGFDLDEVVLAIFNQRQLFEKNSIRHAAMQAATRELERVSNLNAFLQKIAEEKEQLPARIMDLSEHYLSTCIGAKVYAVNRSHVHDSLNFDVSALCSSDNNLFIKPFDRMSEHILYISNTGEDFTFNHDVTDIINVWWQIANGHLNDYYRQADLLEQSHYRAIAQTTQMFAHDVRKPFSILKSILKEIERTDTASPLLEQQKNAVQFLPEVERAMDSVNGMIEDILEISRVASLTTDDTSLVALIQAAVDENCRYHVHPSDKFSYNFSHTHQVTVNKKKIHRVFSNIIDNAIQATGGCGQIWFDSIERDSFIEVVIGNDNSSIKPELWDRIFDAFYTAEKPDGTGLGLAIAKKIIEAHGGKIWCRSDVSINHTYFHLLLPKGPAEEICISYQPLVPSTDLKETSHSASESGKNRYIVVDDDAFIRYAWTDLSSLKNVITFKSPEHFWTEVRKEPLLLRETRGIVTDFYFEKNSRVNGIDFAKSLRAAGYKGRILLSSDSEIGQTISPTALANIGLEIAAKDPVSVAVNLQ